MTTLRLSRERSAAVTEESTPPLIATTVAPRARTGEINGLSLSPALGPVKQSAESGKISGLI